MTEIKDNILTYDYIIIGGGTSGSVAARRIAEGNVNFTVCLLEAGPSNDGMVSSQMPGGWKTLRTTPLDWNFNTTPQTGFNNRIAYIPQARFLGGCSAMNGTVLLRGVKGDYDRIEKMGNPGWSWNEMLPFFKASETFHPSDWHQADMNCHGTNGPLNTTVYPIAPISKKVLESFIDSGFDYKPDMFVQGEYEGIGHATRTVYNGIRNSSADFIHSYNKANLTVRTGIFVDRIILEKNNSLNKEEHEYKAIGVEAHDEANGQLITIKARKEIILSAGAYKSPVILMHSGIGWEKHLTEMNIDCKVNLHGVGENLLDHVVAYASYQVNDPDLTLNSLVYHPDALTLSIKNWEDTKTGVMANVPIGCYAYKRVDQTIQDPIWEAEKQKKQSNGPYDCDPAGQWPNQPHVELATTEIFMGAPHIRNTDGQPYDPINGEGVITLFVFLCGPQSRGTVRLSSKDPRSMPIIDHAWLNNDLDVTVLAEGCRLGHEVLTKGKGTKDLIIGPWPKTFSYPETTTDWKEYVRVFSDACYHAGGTCKMAPDSDPMGVVDCRLRVRNVTGLRVADMSIMPILNCGHTQAPAYAIGEKVAYMVLEDANDSSTTNF